MRAISIGSIATGTTMFGPVSLASAHSGSISVVLRRLLALSALGTVAAPIVCAQALNGTMTTVLGPSGKSAEAEYQAHLFELRAGGLSELQLQLSEAEMRHTAERRSEGLECSGPFSFEKDGVSTWMTYPVASTAIGKTVSQHSESFDGTTTVLVHSDSVVVQPGDARTFTGSPFWELMFFGTVQSWLSETSRTQSGQGETVTYEGVHPEGLVARAVVTYTGNAQGEITSVAFGWPSDDRPFHPSISGTRNPEGSEFLIKTHLGAKVLQSITVSVSEQSETGSPELLKSVKPGSNVIDMRLGKSAPVNYVFSGSLPDVEDIATKGPTPRGFETGLALLGAVGLGLAVFLWRKR